MKKHIISLFALTTVLLAATTTSCTDELVSDTATLTGAFTPKGEIVDAYLSLNVAELSIKSTTRAVADDSEDERRINDIWVFQYDYKEKTLINTPYYHTISNQQELADLTSDVDGYPIKVSDNDGAPSIIYVVANTHDNSWYTSDKIDDFNSLEKLKQQTIPNPEPIRMNSTGDEVEGDVNGETTLYIPMGGSRGEDGKLVVYEGYRIQVDVERMFAKLYVNINLTNGETVDSSNMLRLMIENISRSCTVATIFDDDSGDWYYPDGTGSNFEVSRVFIPDDDTTSSEDGGKSHSYGPFIMYVPENYQSESNVYALKLTPYLNYQVLINDDGETATITPDPSYTAYPGSWDTTSDNPQLDDHGINYEIRRNNIYDITLNIVANDGVTASDNSFIAPAYTTIAFYPYVRDEVPTSQMIAEGLENRYTFTNYLNSSYEDGEDKKIKGVTIIWQTQDCIGDNTNHDLVWIDDAPSDGDEATKSYNEYRRKIYVKVNKPGNALIAAYDDEACEGNILWSWHIWVPNTDVDPEGGAIEYYHLIWNSTGIQEKQYELGRLVMNLNLGALKETPTNPGSSGVDHDTYGMLYQWGRKDPFLPMKVTSHDGAGIKGGHNFYNYADYTTTGGSDSRDYDVVIGAYNNANQSVPMTGNDGSINSYNQYLFDTNSCVSDLGSDGFVSTDDNAVILSSIQHPTTFLAASGPYTATGSGTGAIGDHATYYNEGDWLPVNDDFLWGGGHTAESDATVKELHVYTQQAADNGVTALKYSSSIDAYLEDDYGTNKTIFDPCPHGWRVSPGDIWLGFTADGLNWKPSSGTAAANWEGSINNLDDETLVDIANQCGYTMYMQGWKTGKTSFFPIQGTRISSGQPYNIGPRCGNYHNATVDRRMNFINTDYWIRRVDILHFHSENSSDASKTVDGGSSFICPFAVENYYYDKSVAGPLRCVRDTNVGTWASKGYN